MREMARHYASLWVSPGKLVRHAAVIHLATLPLSLTLQVLLRLLTIISILLSMGLEPGNLLCAQ